MVMAGLLAPQALGLYVVAVAWSGGALPVFNALSDAMLPHLARMSSRTEQLTQFARNLHVTVIIAAGGALGTALAAPLAVSLLFGARYKEAVPTAMVLCAATGFLVVKQALQTGAQSLGLPKLGFWAEIGGLAMTVTLLVLLLPRLGMMGAAIASLTSYALATAVMVVLLCRATGASALDLLIPTRGDVRMIASRLRRKRSA
jgi:O-antigen/teichoic acid export membrane protein